MELLNKLNVNSICIEKLKVFELLCLLVVEDVDVNIVCG